MEPPLKRQRMLDVQERERLDKRRAYNDFRLKSRFESIFEKYGKDFSGVGDVIDLQTGKLVVNNGHLITMEHERDELGADFNSFPDTIQVANGDSITEKSPAESPKILSRPEQETLPLGEVSCAGLDIAAAIMMDDGSLYDDSVHGQLFIDSDILKKLSRLGPHIRKSVATAQRSATKSVVVSVETEDLAIDPIWRVPEVLQLKANAETGNKALEIQNDSAINPSPELEFEKSPSPDGRSLWTLETSSPSGKRSSTSSGIKWTAEMDLKLWDSYVVEAKSFKQIAAMFPGRTSKAIQLRLNHLKLKRRLSGHSPVLTAQKPSKIGLPSGSANYSSGAKMQHSNRHVQSTSTKLPTNQIAEDATDVRASSGRQDVEFSKTRQTDLFQTPMKMDVNSLKIVQANGIEQSSINKGLPVTATPLSKGGRSCGTPTSDSTNNANTSQPLADSPKLLATIPRGNQRSKNAETKQAKLKRHLGSSNLQVLVGSTAREVSNYTHGDAKVLSLVACVSNSSRSSSFACTSPSFTTTEPLTSKTPRIKTVFSCQVPSVEKIMVKSTPTVASSRLRLKAAQEPSKPSIKVRKSSTRPGASRTPKAVASRVSKSPPIVRTPSLNATKQAPITSTSVFKKVQSSLYPPAQPIEILSPGREFSGMSEPSHIGRTSSSIAAKPPHNPTAYRENSPSSHKTPTSERAKSASRGSTPDLMDASVTPVQLPSTPVRKRSLRKANNARKMGAFGVSQRRLKSSMAGEASDDELAMIADTQ
jgi:hypothetical protein